MATEVASIYAKVGADMGGFKRGMTEFRSDLDSSGTALGNFNNLVSNGIKAAVGIGVTGIAALGTAIVASTKSAADMEQGVADIGAVMGASAEQTRALSDLITNLGIDPKLKVTATEAADAIESLAKNGLSLEEIMNGAARSTVLLSHSTGGDFTTSADVATSAMAQFKISAQDMTKAVDQIVGVTINSKFGIDDYRLAISQAGGVASSVGVSFADFNAVIAATSPLFASGSDAGTSFKTFLQRLVPDSEPAIAALKQIGIVTEDGKNKFFTASGEMRSMSEIAAVLQTAFSGLTEEQKINTATNIFGTDAMRTAFALADGGAGVIDNLKTTIGNTSAEESAATRMNTLKGSWEIFTGIVESLSIKFGEAFLPSARDVVDILTDLATEVGPTVIDWGEKFGERLKAVTVAAVELIGVGMDEGWSTLFTPLDDGSRKLDTLFEAFGMTKEQAKETSQKFLDTIQTVKDMATAIVSLISTIKDVVSPIYNFTQNTVGLETILKAVGLLMAGSFIASIVSTISTIAGVITSVASFALGLTGLGATATTIGGAIVTAISAIGGPITLVVAAVAGLAIAWTRDWGGIRTLCTDVWISIRDTVSNGVGKIKESITGIDWGTLGKNMMRGLSDGITGAWSWVKDAATGAAQAAMSAAKSTLGIQSPSKEFEAIGNLAMEGFGKGIEKKDSALVAMRQTLFAIQKEGTSYTNETVRARLNEAAGLLFGTFGEALRRGAPNFSGDMQAILGTIVGTFNGVMDSFKRHSFDVMSGIGFRVIDGIVEGIKRGADPLRNALNWVTSAMPDWVKNALGIRSPSKVFAEIGKNISMGLAEGIKDNIKLPELSVKRLVKTTVDAPRMALSQTVSAESAGARNRLDVYLHAETQLPTNRQALREIVIGLQRELQLTGARVAY